MEASFLVAMAVSGLLLSALLAARLAAVGRPGREIVRLVIELWVTFALWVAALQVTASTRGRPGGWAVGGLVVAAGLVVHLLWQVRRNMSGEIR